MTLYCAVDTFESDCKTVGCTWTTQGFVNVKCYTWTLVNAEPVQVEGKANAVWMIQGSNQM